MVSHIVPGYYNVTRTLFVGDPHNNASGSRMKDRIIYTYGSRTNRNYDSNGEQWGSGSSETTRRVSNFKVFYQTTGDKTRCNPLEWERLDRYTYEGSYRKPTSWGYTVYSGVIGSLPPKHAEHFASDGRLDTLAYNAALSRFYSQIRNTDLNLAITIGESPEVLEMARAAIRLAKGLRKAVRWAKRNPHKLLSSSYLLYAFGIKPMISDLYAAMDFAIRRQATIKVRGRGRSLKDYNWSYYSHTGSGKYSIRWEIGATLVQSGELSNDMASISTLNPAAIAWELTPLSFLVDYVFNIGGYLASLEGAIGVGWSFKNGYQTKTILVSDTAKQGDSYKVEDSTLTAFSQYRYMRRMKLDGLPLPRLPTFDLDLNSGQLINAAAVANEILVKTRR